MKKVFVLVFGFLFTFLGIFVRDVSAKIIAEENRLVVISKSEVIDDDLFVAAQSIEIAGVVNGDVFVGAESVVVTGTINGNLHSGSNLLDLEGTVRGNVYAGAQNVTLKSAVIGGSLLVGAATVSLDEETTVGGSIITGAGTVSINSQIKRSVYAGTGNLMLGAGTVIGKDLYYAVGNGQEGASISPSAKVTGNIYKSEVNTQVSQKTARQTKSAFAGVRVVTGLLSLVGTLIVSFFYFKFFGHHFTETTKLVTASFWKSMGVGFLATLVIIPGLIVLLITVVGIPLAGITFLMFLLFAYLAKIIVSQPLGVWLSKKINWPISFYGASAFGLLTIYIIRAIPILGPLAGLIIFWLGLGALTLQTLSKFK